ncbi:protein kinase domain-containing protein [Streptomyces sp. NPDC002643]
MPTRGASDRVPAPEALKRSGALPLRPGDPDRVGPYVSLGLLGSGGMGRVYVARPMDGSPELVAVKVIRPEYAEDVRFRRRFEREASVHERVRTPNMPRLCGTGFDDELLWMATEYLPGLDLSVAVQEGGALGAATVWRLVAELGRTLADLSAAGIVHRDLKPSNVLLSVRGAHVIDFGIAKAADASAITGTGNRVGTPAYMSPEYLRTGECDTASDVFSLACTLVYAVTGSAPFGDGTGVDVMHRVAFEEPNAKVIGEIAAADATLAALLTACLAKEPGQRPTPQDLVEAARPHAGARGGAGAAGASDALGGAKVAGASGAAAAMGAVDWSEPLGGRVRARQRAYEELRVLPLEQVRRGPSESERSAAGAAAASAGGAARDEGAAQDKRETPGGEGARPGAAAVEEKASRSAASKSRTRTRRKQVSVVAASVALCAVAAGTYVLTRPDASTTEAREPGRSTAVDGVPGDDDASSTASGPSADGVPVADGGASVSEVSGEGGKGGDGSGVEDGTADVDAPGSSPTGEDGGTEPSTPGTTTDGPAEPTPTQSSSPPTSGDPAWVSDCTYYNGNGNTKPGQSGNRVVQVQCILIKRGYDVGSDGMDGYFGEGTEAAVIAFQTDHGLDADGVVRPSVWPVLRGSE